MKSLVVLKHGDGVAGSVEDEEAERGCIAVLADAFPGAERIGLIAYTDLKPDDYWTKVGYDWYAGL